MHPTLLKLNLEMCPLRERTPLRAKKLGLYSYHLVCSGYPCLPVRRTLQDRSPGDSVGKEGVETLNVSWATERLALENLEEEECSSGSVLSSPPAAPGKPQEKEKKSWALGS